MPANCIDLGKHVLERQAAVYIVKLKNTEETQKRMYRETTNQPKRNSEGGGIITSKSLSTNMA